MPLKGDGCTLNEDVRNKIRSLYQESLLDTVEYVRTIFPNDKFVIELTSEYQTEISTGTDENESNKVFWQLMWYIGMDNKLDQ